MGARYGGRIKGKRVNRNRGASSGQKPRPSFTSTLGRMIPNAFPPSHAEQFTARQDLGQPAP